MKKNLTISICLIAISLVAKSQNINFTKEDLIGRWIEIKRIEGEKAKEITVHHDTYIFKDDNLFHKGEASEGIVLFNITGRYAVEKDSITIVYKDYLTRESSKAESKNLTFRVLAFDKKNKEILVSVIDYDYEYQMILKK